MLSFSKKGGGGQNLKDSIGENFFPLIIRLIFIPLFKQGKMIYKYSQNTRKNFSRVFSLSVSNSKK
jgi:hypothetical protein